MTGRPKLRAGVAAQGGRKRQELGKVCKKNLGVCKAGKALGAKQELLAVFGSAGSGLKISAFIIGAMLADEILTKLEIQPLDELKIHEQVMEPNLHSLRETMLNLGKLVDPLIVDKKHKIVLDGNHRRMVLEILKADNAVCQMVDYDDPQIQVGGWHIATKAKVPQEGGKAIDEKEGFEALQKMEGCLMHIKKGKKGKECSLICSQSGELQGIMDEQKQFLAKKLNLNSFEKNNNGNGAIQFIEDSRVDYFLENGYEVFARRIFTKKEIVGEAAAGRPLPPKSTRHMIPNRIIRLNFRLGYLNDSPESASMHLRDMVIKRVKYGSARYYTEPVIVLY